MHMPQENDKRSGFQKRMIDYIKSHFGDLLGSDVKLLDLPNGLDLVQEKYGLERLRRRNDCAA